MRGEARTRRLVVRACRRAMGVSGLSLRCEAVPPSGAGRPPEAGQLECELANERRLRDSLLEQRQTELVVRQMTSPCLLLAAGADDRLQPQLARLRDLVRGE